MSEPMPVTTRIISADRWSRRSANGTCSVPDDIHVKTVLLQRARRRPTASSETDSAETANDAIIARQASPPETDFGSRRPKKALTRKPASGSRGISKSIEPTGLSEHIRVIVNP